MLNRHPHRYKMVLEVSANVIKYLIVKFISDSHVDILMPIIFCPVKCLPEKYHILPNELLKVVATVMVCLEVEL